MLGALRPKSLGVELDGTVG
jgi:hypothetical protein